jgi:N-acetylglucosaminyl-diphospho-decaprenol L-rhamnosyltransferase
VKRVTFVIVTWNSASTIGELLDSIAASTAADRCAVVVIDNDSKDRTVDVVEQHAVKPALVRNSSNRGLAAANNQGLNLVETEFACVTNPDVVLDADCIDRLLECADRHPRAGFAIARLRNPDGSLQPGVGDLPRLGEVLLGRRASLRRQQESAGIWWDGWPHDSEAMIGHGQEACYLVRAAAVAEVGGQDERYTLDWEGLDWSARMHEAGWEIWFCPTAGAVHIGGVSVRQAQARWIMRSHRGMYMYFADRLPRIYRPLLAATFGARALTKLLVWAVKRDAYGRVTAS